MDLATTLTGFVALYIFMLAAFTGYEIIGRVPAILHTPLMSGSNFVHGIVVVGAMYALLNATSMFNHGNVRLPAAADRLLRSVLVTPDMHRVHHSVRSEETNSNYGFCLSWWDRSLGTYRAQPAEGHEGMTIGLESLQDARNQSLAWLLRLPALARGRS